MRVLRNQVNILKIVSQIRSYITDCTYKFTAFPVVKLIIGVFDL